MLVNRIGNRMLGTLCERIGVGFDVGHDPHKIFRREADSINRFYASRMGQIASQVEAGTSLSDALRKQGNYFPDNFVQMMEVGERTGRLEVVLSRMASYYNDLADIRSEFINLILWPVTQLLLAVIVVAVLIYLPATISPQENIDLLGIGLTGARGLRIYLTGVAIVGGAFTAIVLLARGGYLSFIAGWLSHAPFLKRWVNLAAEARFVQTLALALESGLDTWHSVELAFKSASSGLFYSKAENAKLAVRQGRELHVVLGETGLFSKDTLDAARLGEESGRLAEILDKQFQYLRIQTKNALTKMSYLASSVIWIGVAAVLIMIIIRVYSTYLQNLDPTEVLEQRFPVK